MSPPARFLLLFCALLCVAFPGTSRGQLSSLSTKPKHLNAELISQVSVVGPGKPFHVLVKLELEKDWHTYGKTVAEGVTGKPTELTWTLPEGWKAEELPWPATEEVPSAGGTTTQAYEGRVYLPAKITPPEKLPPGTTAKIEVKVDAIVCNLENCVPVRDLNPSLELKTGESSEADAAHEDLFKKMKGALLSEQSTIAPGKPFRVVVKLEVAPGFHTYSKSLPENVTGSPTALEWKLPEGWKASDLPWPATHEVASPEGKVPAYEGTVYLPALITPSANLAPGSTSEISVTVDAVVCDEQNCVPIRDLNPSLQLKAGAEPVVDAGNAKIFKGLSATETTTAGPAAKPVAATAATPQAPHENLALYLLFAFIGGLILNIMPCVFPVLAIKITSVVSQAHDEKSKVLMHGIAYTFGVLLSLWVLDGILIAANAGGGHKGWGYQFQEPWFVFGVVLIMLIFGLNMAGLFEVGTSAVGVGDKLTAKSGYAGSFFSGLFATVVATPCTAPFLANALTFALSLPPLGSLGIFTFIGLGLSFPYLLFGLFPSLLKMLPRPGVWMESFKQAMSFPMLGAAAYFTWVLLGLVSDDNGRDILIGIVIIAMALWVYGRWSVLSKPTPVRVRAIAIAIAFFVLGLWWANPKAEGAKTEKNVPGELTWKPWSPEAVAELRKDNKPVYIDFTARWCATCQVNHRVYSNTALAEDFKKRGVTLLKADWTKPDERIEKALTDLGESAVPVDILYVPGRDKPVVLPKTLTVSNVQAALAELGK